MEGVFSCACGGTLVELGKNPVGASLLPASNPDLCETYLKAIVTVSGAFETTENQMIKPHHCPVCEKQFDTMAEAGKSHFPFCSDRCKRVDLFRWFDGRYAIVEDVDPMVAEFLRDDPDIRVQGEGLEGAG